MSIGVGHYPYFNFPLVNIVGTLTVEAFGASDVPWPRCPCVPVAGETWGWAVRACLGKPWNAHALKIRNQLHCIILLYYTILTYSLYIYTILRLCMTIYHSLNRHVCPNLGWRKSNLKPCDKWCDAAVFLISHHGRWSSFLVSDNDIPVHHRNQNKAAIACYCYFSRIGLIRKIHKNHQL